MSPKTRNIQNSRLETKYRPGDDKKQTNKKKKYTNSQNNIKMSAKVRADQDVELQPVGSSACHLLCVHSCWTVAGLGRWDTVVKVCESVTGNSDTKFTNQSAVVQVDGDRSLMAAGTRGLQQEWPPFYVSPYLLETIWLHLMSVWTLAAQIWKPIKAKILNSAQTLNAPQFAGDVRIVLILNSTFSCTFCHFNRYLIAVENKSIASLGLRQCNAGNSPPASCIFSEVMNLAAFAGLIIAVLRYLQLKHRVNKPWLNMSSAVAFSGSCFGMTVVGNFQIGALTKTHTMGMFSTFGLGLLFCWIQSYVTIKAKLMNDGKKVGIIRFLLSGSITVCMILSILSLTPASEMHSSRLFVKKQGFNSELFSSSNNQGIHIHAARCQWALVMFFLVFLGTFTVEFRHYRFHLECTENPGNPVRLQESLPEVTVPELNQM
ncbi:Transmembrane protein 150C [Channa argus]|uniref:Transmembrane protein 150C n=1 Tax=Channa argus TaxID=215402 RepID=A0A6G1QGQ9_CHAAH|nr:Transmembrane protein 150C [Channa argus]